MADFDAELEARHVKETLVAKDKRVCGTLLAALSTAQRQAMVTAYRAVFVEHLVEDVKATFSGVVGSDFARLACALITPPAEYDASQLFKAIEGLGTDEATLIEILATRSNEEIKAIRKAYRKLFSRDLEHDVIGDTSGSFQNILVSLLQGERDEGGEADERAAFHDAEALFEAGEKSAIVQSHEFNRVFMLSSPAQLRAVADAYTRVSNLPLAEVLSKKVSGDFGKTLIVILMQATTGLAEYFADRLYKAMKGAGTDDVTLVRVVVTRREKEMPAIREAFLRRHGKTLGKMIAGDCSGEYRDLLLRLVGD